ncbi:MAG: PqqD family protein [Bacteroidales bacterium]|nr:PqqD family protein [Bacteroidales bacterium]
MKIKEGYMLREIADMNVVVPIGERVVDFNGLITLNETGTFLWKQLQGEVNRRDLINALLKEYEVSEDTASKDVDEFINSLKERNILDL